MLAPPPVEFVVRRGVHIAYQSAGSGPPDIVFVGGAMAMSVQWEQAATAKSLRRLASFARLITYDQQGMGFSDRMDLSAPPTMEDLVADLEAVVAAAGLSDPILFGTHNGGAVAALYAARHPVRQLVLCNTWARLEVADDFPIGLSEPRLDRLGQRYKEEWGGGRISDGYASRRGDATPSQYELASTSHNQLAHLFEMNRRYDIRSDLPAVSAPTLVIHLEGNKNIPVAHGEYIAGAIPGAQLVLLPGEDHFFLLHHGKPVVDEVEQFVLGHRTLFADRMRTTILFTDIVDSTSLAASIGDDRWSALIDEHNDRVHLQVVAHAGHEVKSTGDGFLVAFDDPEQAIRCARACMAAVRDLDLVLRAGVHMGEVARMGKSDLSGLAVHFAQRICGSADGDQVLVSAAVRGSCAGSGLAFDARGEVELRGIPGSWEVFEASLSQPEERHGS
jgi:class 3 adenylate cyclase/pimeloyl-ACP methyl ester carboxylesterase